MLLLTDLATIEESAESVRIAGLTQHTCLALLHLYQQQNGEATKLSANTRIKDLKVGFVLAVLYQSVITNILNIV